MKPDILLTAREVRETLGGVTDMSLWRWLNDDRLDFPKPVVIRRRRYWRQSEIAAFQTRQGAAA